MGIRVRPLNRGTRGGWRARHLRRDHDRIPPRCSAGGDRSRPPSLRIYSKGADDRSVERDGLDYACSAITNSLWAMRVARRMKDRAFTWLGANVIDRLTVTVRYCRPRACVSSGYQVGLFACSRPTPRRVEGRPEVEFAIRGDGEKNHPGDARRRRAVIVALTHLQSQIRKRRGAPRIDVIIAVTSTRAESH